MPISIEVRTENGEPELLFDQTIDRQDLPRLSDLAPFFRGVDPYGNTILNYLQREEVIRQVDDAALQQGAEFASLLSLLRAICVDLRPRVHHYLWFIGD